MEKIEDDIHLHREKSRAEAALYHKVLIYPYRNDDIEIYILVSFCKTTCALTLIIMNRSKRREETNCFSQRIT
jgi:hypothetical protein